MTDFEKDPEGAYAVGYRKPPLHSRFKSGQSGNPKGRRRGRKNVATILQEALSQTLEVRQGNTVRKMPAIEGIVHRMVVEALKGNIKFIALILSKEPEIARAIAARAKDITPQMSIEEAAAAWMQTLSEGNEEGNVR